MMQANDPRQMPAAIIPDGIEIFLGSEIGFGQENTDLAVVRIVSRVGEEVKEHFFAMHRTELSYLGLRMAFNAERAGMGEAN